MKTVTQRNQMQQTCTESRHSMKTIITLAALVLGFASSVPLGAAEQSDIAAVRRAVAQFQRVELAPDAGWDLVPGLDYCFQSEAGGMGIHYINLSLLLNTEIDPLQPEALVYHHLPNGKLQLGAVEYIVPADLWDAEGHENPPVLFGQHFHLDEALGVYVLHLWLFTHNPAGMFEDWNPLVSCPK